MDAFGQIARSEVRDLASVFQSTLTFTVTFQAVSSLIEQEESSVPVLLAATIALTFVLLALIEPAQALPAEVRNLAKYLLGLAAKLGTQFVSNLVAVSLRTVFVDAITTWWIIAFSLFSISLLWTATQRLV